MGPSGCGKTTLLMNLLLQKDWMDYDKVILCGRSLHQPEYQLFMNSIQKGYNKDEVRSLFELGPGGDVN